MKWIPNILTVSRILFALFLALLKPLSIAFYTIYLFCGISDMLDGYIARKTHSESKLGAKLDSAADMILSAVLLMVLLPILHLDKPLFIYIGAVVLIRLTSIFLAYLRYKTFAVLHTYGNKLTGFLLFVSPLLLAFVLPKVVAYLLCTIAFISAAEEMIIHITSNELDANRKSLFFK